MKRKEWVLKIHEAYLDGAEPKFREIAPEAEAE